MLHSLQASRCVVFWQALLAMQSDSVVHVRVWLWCDVVPIALLASGEHYCTSPELASISLTTPAGGHLQC